MRKIKEEGKAIALSFSLSQIANTYWKEKKLEQVELSLEQQFNILAFQQKVQPLTREQAQQLCVDLYRQMIIKESMWKSMLGQNWGFLEVPE